MNFLNFRKKHAIRHALLSWYSTHGRDLPWRKTASPYRILIAELMLQQTQVPRVILKFKDFLRVFPSFAALSRATPGKVIAHWQGLGYNRRALWIHAIAREVTSRHGGRLPHEYNDLRALPGIGDYTARAVRAFAFRKHEPVVDVNVRRVLSRVTRAPAEAISTDVARSFLPPGNAYDWNQALMDVGSMFCTARKPDCGICPLRLVCSSAGRVTPAPATRTRAEPGRHGIPRRIYRGKILKELAVRSPLSGPRLATNLGLRSSAVDLRWLNDVVKRMRDEGLLRLESRRGGWSIRKLA